MNIFDDCIEKLTSQRLLPFCHNFLQINWNSFSTFKKSTIAKGTKLNLGAGIVADKHHALRIPFREIQAESLMHRSPGQHAPGKQESTVKFLIT